MPAAEKEPSAHLADALHVRSRNLPHWEQAGCAYFVTWRMKEGQPHLLPLEKDIVLSALRHFNHQRYELYAYVVMDDHVHVVMLPLAEHTLGQILHSWKSYTAHQLQRESNRHGAVWQPDSFDRLIASEHELRQKCEYVLANPQRRWPGLSDYPWAGWM